MGQVDPIGFVANVSVQDMHEFQTSSLAKTMHSIEQLSDAKGYLVRTVQIIDMKGLGLKHVSANMIEYLRVIAKIVQDNFPETLFRCFLVNVPMAFFMAWKVAKTFLEPEVVEKVVILDSHLEALFEQVPRENLPLFLGGLNQQPLFSDPEEFYDTFSIGSNTPLHISLSNSGRIEWEFRAERNVRMTVSVNGLRLVDNEEKKALVIHRGEIELTVPNADLETVQLQFSVVNKWTNTGSFGIVYKVEEVVDVDKDKGRGKGKGKNKKRTVSKTPDGMGVSNGMASSPGELQQELVKLRSSVELLREECTMHLSRIVYIMACILAILVYHSFNYSFR